MTLTWVRGFEFFLDTRILLKDFFSFAPFTSFCTPDEEILVLTLG